MKYTVKVDEQLFEVEITDLRSRPIIALVDGEPIEVWPEGSKKMTAPALLDKEHSQQNLLLLYQPALVFLLPGALIFRKFERQFPVTLWQLNVKVGRPGHSWSRTLCS